MASLVVSSKKSPGANGGTTDDFDSTNGDLVVVVVHSYGAGTSPATVPSDSKGNSYTARTAYDEGTSRIRIFDAQNATVGSGHNVTFSDPSSYPTIHVLVFSGAALSSAYDTGNGATDSNTSMISTGSITPAEDGEILVSGVTSNQANTWTVDSGLTLELSSTYSAGVGMGGFTGYLIQGSAAAINPTWQAMAGSRVAATIAAYLPAPSPEASLADGIEFGDSVTGAAGLLAITGEGLTLSDSISAAAGFAGTVADGCSLGDSITATVGRVAELGEAISTGDVAAGAAGLAASVGESIVFADQAAGTAGLQSAVAEGLKAADTVVALAALSAELLEGSTVSDATTAVRGLLAEIEDGLLLADLLAAAPGGVLRSIGYELDAHLVGLASIAALVGVRIWPNAPRQAATLPFIVLKEFSAASHSELSGASVGTAVTRFEVSCYAATKAGAKQLAELVRLAIQGYRGDMGTQWVEAVVNVGTANTGTERFRSQDCDLRWVSRRDYLVTHSIAVEAS